MKGDHVGATACDCGASRRDRPCAEALSAYRRALPDGGIPAGSAPPCLTGLGLLTPDEDTGRLLAVPPDAARFAVLAPLQDEIAARRRTLGSLSARLAAFDAVYADEQRRTQPAFVRLTDRTVINAALEAAVGACRRELLTAQPGGGRAVPALREALGRDLRALRRGVRQRTIYQHTVHRHRPTMAYIERVSEAGAQVRTLAEVVERLIVCDRTVAFIPLSEDAEEGALQIRDPSMVRFVVRFFDQAWERSTPVRPTEPAGGRSPAVDSELQRTILRAVVSGETDSAIARRLGMSRRSVAEHIRKVSVRLGSGSRAQLGFLLARSGLLEDGAPGPG